MVSQSPSLFKVGDKMQLCLTVFPMEYPGAGCTKDKYEHWFVTNGDGSWVLEFAEYGRGPTDIIVGVHCNPRGEYKIKDTFILTQEVMDRMKKVVGTTNYSVALRNCEHVARYVQCGSWVSFQMSSKGMLRKMFEEDVSQGHGGLHQDGEQAAAGAEGRRGGGEGYFRGE